MSKVAIAGLDKAGKSSIYKIAVEEATMDEVDALKPTRGIEHHEHRFLDKKFAIWDLGGQLQYRESHLSKPEVFDNLDVLVFVFDLQDLERLDESYQYFVAILQTLLKYKKTVNKYVLFHKFDPARVSNLRKNFYKATKIFRQADAHSTNKFKGFATSIFSNSVKLAMDTILFENFEGYTEPEEKVKLKKIDTEETDTYEFQSGDMKEGISVPKPIESVDKPTKTPVPLINQIEEGEIVVDSHDVEEKETVDIHPDDESDVEVVNMLIPQSKDISEVLVDRLSSIVKKILNETPEIDALLLLTIEGSQVFAVGKTEETDSRIGILQEVIVEIDVKKFFNELGEIEYRGLGHFTFDDFDIYFAKVSDEYTAAVITTDVSTVILRNAQRMIDSIRQGLNLMPSDGEETENAEETPSEKGEGRDLVADLRKRLTSLNG